MRPEAAWSMSTVGLTAQETSFPLENHFWGSCCHSMDSKSSWGYPHESHNFSIKSAYTDQKVNLYQKESPPLSPSYERHSPGTQRLKKSRPSYLSLSCTSEPSTPSPPEDTHTPSQPQSTYRNCSPPQTPGRCSKPLPPIPLQKDSSSVQSLDNEDYFTHSDESCRLLADKIIKPMRFGFGRRSFRIHGQVNHAFSEHGPQSPKPSQTPQHHHHPANHHHSTHHHGNHHQGLYLQTQTSQERHELQPELPEQRALHQQTEEIPICSRQLQDKTRRVRRTQSGPAGSFHKPCYLNLQSKRNNQGTYKPEVPPPIPPRLHKMEDPRRWSVALSGAYSDEPPKLPPRDPLSRGCSRTPSPKSLPLYVNGEMPPTQSFAPDPKYVYRGLMRQNSEGSPCIFPVMVNGQKDSHTHYFLLDGPPARDMDESSSEWDYRSQKKASIDLV
ncbi:hypothetical protein WMY93_011642 [Mugilogobius chulae]|uniref:ERBB receptor feedback inhibitor 1 n=1 Tax=Mugilogobius chulae TaxID=88201 RepID=A0AAW0P6E5_9GOBI